MKKFLLAMILAVLALGLGAKTFTLKLELSGLDFNWADGSSYVGDPYPGPAAGDTIVVPSGMTAIANAAASTASGVCGVCEVQVKSGAVLQMQAGKTERQFNLYLGKITGEGTVRNPNSIRQDIFIQQSCEFGGKFEGMLDYCLRNGVTFAFLNSDQCFTTGSPILYNTSTLKVYRFFPKTASKSGASVLGTQGNFNFGDNNTIQYVGESGLRETLNRSYWSGNYITYDAGAYGGLTISSYTTACGWQRMYTLTGSNTTVSTFYSNIDYRKSNKNPAYAYTRKSGSGTWLLKSASNSYTGGIVDIYEGTLQIDSLAEAGKNCSLGMSTNLLMWGTAVTADRKVDYAVIIGGGKYPAKLDYIGGTAASCSTRPLIITNEGAIASSQGALTFNDISAAGLGTHTLILSGDGDVVNSAGNVRDGSRGGNLNVVKEGSCTWNLTASGDITGYLKVKGGTLSAVVPEELSSENDHYQFESVSVSDGGIFESNGGALSVDNIIVDASASAGSFRNVVFPKKGIISVENYPAGLKVLPIYVGNIESRENLCDWTLLVNGKAVKRQIRINSEGYLEFVSVGFKILYRQ